MRLLILGSILTASLWAQLTIDQRETDFRTLTTFVARYYAPLDWKRQAHQTEGLALEPWLSRVRQTKSDIEFRLLCAEYLAQFRDGHVAFAIPSTFVADGNLRADLFDGKLLIYAVNAAVFPAARFPLMAVGNEVVSLDGTPALAIVDRLSKINPAGAGRAARRIAALNLFRRLQSTYADAVLLPDTSEIVVRDANGAEATYTLPWTKTGIASRDIPTPVSPAAPVREDLAPRSRLRRLREDILEAQSGEDESAPAHQRVLGLGSRNPYYAPPAGFTVRRGRVASDNFFSGTYQADGQRIGLIRIPHFFPANLDAAVAEFSEEIAFFRDNTDGLVVDCTRNTGGYSSLVMAYFARLTTRQYYMPPDQLLPTMLDVLFAESYARAAELQSREQWVIQRWRALANQITRSYQEGERRLTPPLALDIEHGQSILNRAPQYDDNFPWMDASRRPIGYDKPIITLVDDFSGSAGDMFASVVQDNGRGPLVGVRTWGLGGYVDAFPRVLPYTQATVRLTGSLLVRNRMVRTPGLPDAPFIEDHGVTPDIELDHQTRGNLMTQGRDFVNGFTRVMVEEIRKVR